MNEVPMVHLLCKRCGMSATMVVTDTGKRAWSDHMRIHDDELAYEAWQWMVVPLPFRD